MYPNPSLDRIFDIVNPKRSGDSGRSWTGNCPAHDDRHQSLSVGLGSDDRVLLCCHAGCSSDAIRRALGLEWCDLGSPHVPYRPKGSSYPRNHKPQPIRNDPSSKAKTPAQLEKILKLLEADSDCVRGVSRFAAKLGVPSQILWDLGCRWKRIEIRPRNPNDPGELWFPERDGEGKIVGIGIRSWNGDKCFVSGSHRGLLFQPEQTLAGPIFLVEGLTDAAALAAMGLSVVGRPSNIGGVGYLAKLLADVPASQSIVVVGEDDRKENGNWPGRTGAEQTTRELAALLKRPIQAALLPSAFKDSRAWLQGQSKSFDQLAPLYRQSLKVFATFPVVAPDVTDEEIEAATIRTTDKWKSNCEYPEERCDPFRLRHFLLKHKDTHLLRETLTRCGCSECPGCFRRKKRLRLESLIRHFEAERERGGQLHCVERTFTKPEWDALRRTLNRKRANWIRYRQPDGMFVFITTLPFLGSSLLPFGEANEYAKRASDGAITEGKHKSFFSSSKGWAMRREKKESVYQKIGIIQMPPQAVKKLCNSYLGHGRIKQTRPEDSDIALIGYIEYAAPDPMNDEFVGLLLAKSQSNVTYTNGSDIFLPADYGVRCLPPDIDEFYDQWLDPTG